MLKQLLPTADLKFLLVFYRHVSSTLINQPNICTATDYGGNCVEVREE